MYVISVSFCACRSVVNNEESALDRAKNLLKSYESGAGGSVRSSAPAALSRNNFSNARQPSSSSRYDEDDISFDESEQSSESSFDRVGDLETSSTFNPKISFKPTKSSENNSSPRSSSTPSSNDSNDSSSRQALPRQVQLLHSCLLLARWIVSYFVDDLL